MKVGAIDAEHSANVRKQDRTEPAQNVQKLEK